MLAGQLARQPSGGGENVRPGHLPAGGMLLYGGVGCLGTKQFLFIV